MADLDPISQVPCYEMPLCATGSTLGGEDAGGIVDESAEDFESYDIPGMIKVRTTNEV